MAKAKSTTTNGSGNGRKIDEKLYRLINNAMTGRQELFRQFFDPRRDITDECGYPKNLEGISAQEYQDLYNREAIAARVVEVLPRESWQVQPTVYETEDANDVTAFEEGWDNLSRSLRGENSYYGEEDSSPVWEYLQRVDELSGIGYFGVLLLGFDDGYPPSVPMGGAMPVNKRQAEKPGPTCNIILPKNGQKVNLVPSEKEMFGTDAQYGGSTADPSTVSPRKDGTRLLFLRAFPQSLVQVVQYESNRSSPRYGQPIRYAITLSDPRESFGGIGMPMSTLYVHWTRILHVADNRGYSEIFGRPRMRPVLYRLLDLQKLYSGSAEMYWRGAFPGLSLETHPQLGGDVELDTGGLRDMMENYMNGLQRYLSLMGMSAKTLSPQVVDPTPQIDAQIMAICIQLGIPKRVFMGSERGELASSQDDAAWNDRLRFRQSNYITPRIIVPFVDRLISCGVLPVPTSYRVEWPDLDSQTDSDRADLLVKKAQAYSTYVSGNVEALIPPMAWMTQFDNLEEREAASILTSAAEAAESPLAPPAPPPVPPEPNEPDATETPDYSASVLPE